MAINFKNVKKLNIEEQMLILQWRNHENVRKYMYNDNLITENEHINWLKDLEITDTKIAFIVLKDEIPIGFVQFYNIDYNKKTAEWGVYLVPDNGFEGKGYGALIEYYAIEYVFSNLLLKKLSCEVLEFNQTVVKMHKKFGFKDIEYREATKCVKKEKIMEYVLELTREDWLLCKERIEKILKISNKD